MNRINNTGFLFPTAGFIFLITIHLMSARSLASFNFLGFIALVTILPLVILFIGMFLFAKKYGREGKWIYLFALLYSAVIFGETFIFSLIATDEQILSQIIKNTGIMANANISLSQNTFGIVVQNVVVFVTMSCLGTLIGSKISRNKKKKVN